MRTFDRTQSGAPAILVSERADDARSQIEEFLDTYEREGGQRRTPTFRKILSDRQLVRLLYQDFGGVCAFCETANRQPSNKWVSHYRPTSLAADDVGRTSLIHYIWLTLEWQNIYHICPDCQRIRQNAFPILGESRGARDLDFEELDNFENPIILNPCKHCINDTLECDFGGILISRHDSENFHRGEKTIDLFNLNRPSLVAARLNKITKIADWLRRGPSRQRMLEYIEFSGLDLFLTSADKSGVEGVAVYPHSAAATSAIISWGNDNYTRRFNGTSATEFITWFDAMTEEEQTELIEDLEGAIGYSDIEAEKDYLRAEKNKSYTYWDYVEDQSILEKQMTSVQIKNFKAIEYIEFILPDSVEDEELYRDRGVQLAPCMMLLGENATGKSSVLEAITLALLGTDQLAKLDERLGGSVLSPETLSSRQDFSDPYSAPLGKIKIKVGYRDVNESDSTLLEESNETIFGKPKEFFGTGGLSKIVLSYGSRRYFGPRTRRGYRDPWFRVIGLFNATAPLPGPKHWLLNCSDAKFDAAVRALREVLMLDDGQSVRREGGGASYYDIVVETTNGITSLDELSMGYQSVVGLTVDIVRELFNYYDNTELASAVVLLDEIETHLHPRWKMQIMRRLRLAFPNVQFIATTHDPLCLRGMYDGEVFVLRRSTENARVEMLTELPSIRGMRAEQILTSEFFGLGSTDPETDARLARYNQLAARIEDLTKDEHAEMQRLSEALDDGMVLGSTLREQAYAEALKRRVAQREVSPSKAPSPDRADLRHTFSALFERGSS